jgi:hypothetical protein
MGVSVHVGMHCARLDGSSRVRVQHYSQCVQLCMLLLLLLLQSCVAKQVA